MAFPVAFEQALKKPPPYLESYMKREEAKCYFLGVNIWLSIIALVTANFVVFGRRVYWNS